MTDDELVRAFEDCWLPFDCWTHAAHVRVAVTYLREYPFQQALERMRVSLKTYNAFHEVPEGPTSGYNETTTHAFMHLIAATLAVYGRTHPTPTADVFCATHPQLMTRHALRLFYSPQRRLHPLAKTQFVEPDLAPLPSIIALPRMDDRDSQIIIRLLTEAPAPTAVMIEQLAVVFRQAREAHLRFLLDLHDAKEDREYLSGVVLPENHVWVAEAAATVAGFIAFRSGWVNHLYVAPAFQRRGLGSRLLAIAQQWSSDLQLWVFEENDPAVEFYLRRQFHIVERTDGRDNEAKRPDLRMRWAPPASPGDAPDLS